MTRGKMSFRLVTFAVALVSCLNLINQVFLRILAVVLLRHRLAVRAIDQLWSEMKSMPGSCRDEFGRGQLRDVHCDNIS